MSMSQLILRRQKHEHRVMRHASTSYNSLHPSLSLSRSLSSQGSAMHEETFFYFWVQQYKYDIIDLTTFLTCKRGIMCMYKHSFWEIIKSTNIRRNSWCKKVYANIFLDKRYRHYYLIIHVYRNVYDAWMGFKNNYN